MSGTVVTFYACKGGTGRSLALANTAWVLASAGKKVLVIDWDLEAPGLHRYFRPFLLDPDLVSTKGLIDFAIEYALEAAGSASAWTQSLLEFATSVQWEFGAGGIDFVPAGRQDPAYGIRVNDFPWQKFYEYMGGRTLLDGVGEELRSGYDYVLIDSRTGVSDTSGICTVHMPDRLVLCFTMNSQSLQSTAAAAQAIRGQRPSRGLRIFPVAMRVDMMEKDRLDQARMEARQYFDQYVTEQALAPGYWGDVEVPYQPIYSYEELLAPFMDSPGARGTILSAAENLARYLSDGAVGMSIPIPQQLRQEVRALPAATLIAPVGLCVARIESGLGSVTA